MGQINALIFPRQMVDSTNAWVHCFFRDNETQSWQGRGLRALIGCLYGSRDVNTPNENVLYVRGWVLGKPIYKNSVKQISHYGASWMTDGHGLRSNTPDSDLKISPLTWCEGTVKVFALLWHIQTRAGALLQMKIREGIVTDSNST